MLRTIIAGVRARTARLLLSSVAIMLGVAFVTGTLVLGDGITEGMRDEFAKSARGVDLSMSTTGEGPQAETGISQATLDKVRSTPGVQGADLRTVVGAAMLTQSGKAKPATVGPLASTPELREYDLKEGRYPTSPTEAAVDVRTLATAKVSIGQQITLLDKQDGKHPFTIVGTFAQGANSMSLAGSEHFVVLPEVMSGLTDELHAYGLVAKAAPGVTQEQLVADVKKAVGEQGYTFRTGEQLTTETLAQISSRSSEMTQVLLVFALIALVVAAMVIYNTFTILVAQRTRELALMRCVGASRGQVFGSVMAEAFVMGLFASVIGLLGGLGVSALMQVVIGAVSDDNIVVRLPLAPTTVLAAFAVGVLITVVAAFLPAHKATKVAPIAALRAQLDSHEEVARTSKVRIAFALLLGLAGVGVVAFGMNLDEEQALLVTGTGTMLLLAMVVTLGPVLVGPVNRVLGVLPRALFGVPAKLASGNAGRNPKRTAATTAALMIGVTIVSLVTVVATSAKETANAEVDSRFPADYTVTSSVGSRTLPQGMAAQLAAVPEVAKVAPVAAFGVPGPADGGAYLMATTPEMIGDLVKPKATSGAITGLKSGDVAVNSRFAERSGLAVGSTLTLGADATKRDLKVVAVVEGLDASGLVTLDTLRAFKPADDGFDSIMVKLRDGVTAEAGRTAVEKVTDPSPIAVIDSAAETKAQLNTQVDQVLAFIWALIGLAVVIALFGIANTLTLSVLERTRESALLRALGLTKGQLRLMLVVESVLMAVMGAAIGLVLGIGFGGLLVKGMSSDSFPIAFAVPYGQIAVMLLAAVVAAMVAAAMPARRAGRTSVVAGMAEA
ncbi:ABC transporter permease [Umezawaea tangerina]|uniref:Putative ABC transport system permease protein n=1 Tax=Umezawaea tangerina TaxID=84725 RepID=A0A2T0T9P0_9PSEU|nr:FtsX-like permease family protein [Umezawaea tangerina]PRY42383.1 putative ABC transport system permease protein [Umezawaea tangerina]